MARFIHDMTFFHHDVRRKRFNAHRAKANFLSMPICSGIDHKNLRVVERLRGSHPFSGANAGSALHPHPAALKRNVVVVKTLAA